MAKLWFDSQAFETLPLAGDLATIEKWLPSVSSMRFVMHSYTLGRWSDGVTARTIKRALKKGHLDLEIWAYANQVYPFPIPRKLPDGSTDWRERKIAPAKSPTNWVLDMDRVPLIIGTTPAQRIACLVKRLKMFGVFLPRLIVESSPGSFHLVYIGTDGVNEWSRERRLALALRAAGCLRKLRTDKEMDEALRLGGVDPAYLRQDIGLSKFRVPGTVNVKRSCGETDTSTIVARVVTEGWINEAYRVPTPSDLTTLDLFVPPVRKDNLSKPRRALPQDAWKRFLPELKAGLGPLVKGALLEPLCEYVAKNFNFLQKRKCRILQTHMAEALRVEQWAVSRLLRDLKQWGWLVQTGDYKHKRHAKSYGSGPEMKACFEKALFAGRRYDIWAPYKDGESRDHFLRDIRVCTKLGYSPEEIVQIIVEKQSMRPAAKQRDVKSIERTAVLWLNRDQRSEIRHSG